MATRGTLKQQAMARQALMQQELQKAAAGMGQTNVLGPRPQWAHPDLTVGQAANVPNPRMQDIGLALQRTPLGLTQATGSAFEQMGLGHDVPASQLALAAAETGLNIFDMAALGATGPVRAAGRNLLRQLPKGETVDITHFAGQQHPYLSAGEAGTNPTIQGAERMRADRIPTVHGYASKEEFAREPGLGKEVMHARAKRILDTSGKEYKKIAGTVRQELQREAEEAAGGRYAAHIDPRELATRTERKLQELGYRGLKRGNVVTSFADLEVLRRGQVAPGIGAKPTPGQIAQYAESQPDGFTINPMTGEVPSEGIARAVRGGEKQVKGMKAEDVSSYMTEANIKPDEYVGGWANEGTTYLDKTAIHRPSLGGRVAAEAKGEAGYQKALFDIGKGEEIPLTIRNTVEDLPRLLEGRDRGIIGGRETARLFKPPVKAEAIGGPGSAKADLDMLDIARESDYKGMDQDKIYDATGWWKGEDGKWRFEIPDEQATWEPPKVGELDALHERLAKEFPAEYRQYDKLAAEEDYARAARSEMAPGAKQELEKLRRLMGIPKGKSLGMALKNPQTYEHYPNLQDIPLSVREMNPGERGSYGNVPEENIKLNRREQPGQLLSTGKHETQHAIQKREGRSLGVGGPQFVLDETRELMNSTSGAMRELLKARAAVENGQGAYAGLDDATKAAVLDDIDKQFFGYQRAFQDLKAQGGTPDNALDFYRSSLAETEARNVQRRSDMDPEYRRMLTPRETQRMETPDDRLTTGGTEMLVPDSLREALPENMDIGDFKFSESLDADFDNFKKSFTGKTLGTKGSATVVKPERVMFPGVYKDPKQVVSEAKSRVASRNPLMKEIFGVEREDLDAATLELQKRGLRDEVTPPVMNVTKRAAPHAKRVMNPTNVDRLQETLGLAKETPELAGNIGWYYSHPLYQRYAQLLGPDEGLRRFREDMAAGSALSPGTPVDKELRRTSLYNLDPEKFVQGDLTGAEKVLEHYPDLFTDLSHAGGYGHMYHTSAQIPGLQRLQAGGKFYDPSGKAAKTPNYFYSKTGQNLAYPTADAHFVRGIGLSDVRPAVKGAEGSIKSTEAPAIREWFRSKVANPVGLEGSPAQALMWNVLGPQTGVKTKIGKPYLELMLDAAMREVARQGKTINKGNVQEALDKFIMRKGLLG